MPGLVGSVTLSNRLTVQKPSSWSNHNKSKYKKNQNNKDLSKFMVQSQQAASWLPKPSSTPYGPAAAFPASSTEKQPLIARGAALAHLHDPLHEDTLCKEASTVDLAALAVRGTTNANSLTKSKLEKGKSFDELEEEKKY